MEQVALGVKGAWRHGPGRGPGPRRDFAGLGARNAPRVGRLGLRSAP